MWSVCVIKIIFILLTATLVNLDGILGSKMDDHGRAKPNYIFHWHKKITFDIIIELNLCMEYNLLIVSRIIIIFYKIMLNKLLRILLRANSHLEIE